jgi:MFS family permease
MTSTATHRSPNPWLILALICLPVFIGALDLTIVSAFLPEIVVKLQLPLQTSLDEAAWVVSGYLLAYAISMTFMGRVSDLIGRRKVYAACLLIFIAGSILVATADQAPTNLLYSLYRRLGQRPDPSSVTLLAIIIGRVVQALGAGALVPVSLALVGDLFPPGRRAQPLGVIGAVDTLGWVLGHLYGGILVQFLPWQALFWINVPVTLAALALVWWGLRNVIEHRASGRFDFLGSALIVGSLICLNLGLGANIEVSGTASSFQDVNQMPPSAGYLILAAAVLLVGFVLVEARARDPLINLKLFRQRNLSAGAFINLIIGFCLMIGLVSVPILVNVRTESASKLQQAALQVGFLLSTLTVPMALAAIPGGWLSQRYGTRVTTLLGLGLALAGFGLIWRTWYLEIPDLIIGLEMALVGIGIGLTFSPISESVINSAGEDERGVASALVIILRLIGMTVSVSSLTTLSLHRVEQLAILQLGSVADPLQYADTYAHITVQVLAELGLVGAALCGIALVTAFLLRKPTSEPAALRVSDEKARMPMGD